jgi:Kef-type K+ transport system membrane component KefB
MPFYFLADSPVEAKISHLLVQLVVIICAARIAAMAARRLGQPAVVGEIMAGLILGPSLFGKLPGIEYWFQWLFNPGLHDIRLAGLQDVSSMLSQLGLIFLLFLIGLEFDFTHLKSTRGSSLLISVTGVVLPFFLGIALGHVMFPYVSDELHAFAPHMPIDSRTRLGFGLFMGTAMSITAIPILGRIMMEMNIARTKLGAVTITAAAIDDACGWILLATVSAIVNSGFKFGGTVIMITETVLFAALMVLVVRPLVCKWARGVVRANNGALGLTSLAILISLLFLSAIATSKIGIFAIFGAFIFGALLSGEKEFRLAVNNRLKDFVTAFFLPIFFTNTGLRTDMGTIHGPGMWAFAAAVCVVAIVGKFGGCSLAARWSGFSYREATLIGIMMNTRALMELIVIRTGLELGVIPPSVFCMLVMMAVLTTIMTSPLMLRMIPGTELEALVRESGFLRKAA